MAMSKLPPELIREIAEHLSIRPDTQNLALTSKLSFNWCFPLLHEVLVLKSPRWQALEMSMNKHEANSFPSWTRHVRLFRTGTNYSYSPLDFEAILPILERLPRLREIDLTRKYIPIANKSGIARISELVPSLRAFKCWNFIWIDQTPRISFANLVELIISLESREDHESTEREVRALLMGTNGDGPSTSTNTAPHSVSPFTMLSMLSASNPQLRRLVIQLNYAIQARKRIPATTAPLLSNTFPHLTEFSLSGTLEPPSSDILSTFLSSHPHLRSLTFSLPVKDIMLPSSIFPELEYFEGSVSLLAAICGTFESPHGSITKVRVGNSRNVEHVEEHMLAIVPKLPKLLDLYIGFQGSEKATPVFMKVLGDSCPDIRTLSLHDPCWVGKQHATARNGVVSSTTTDPTAL